MKFKTVPKNVANFAFGVALCFGVYSVSNTAITYFQTKKLQSENKELINKVVELASQQRKADSLQNLTDDRYLAYIPANKYIMDNSKPEDVVCNLEKIASSNPKFAHLKDLQTLCSGAFGKRLLDDRLNHYLTHEDSKFFDLIMLARHAKADSLPMLKSEIESLAVKIVRQSKTDLLELFSKLQVLRSDFLNEFQALQNLQTAHGVEVTPLENAASAFYYVMNTHKIFYKAEDNFAKGLEQNHLDCDLSAYMFIQFGREVGLDLIGVNLYPLPRDPAGHLPLHIGIMEK